MNPTTWLPPEAYFKGEPFMLEKSAIFAREWLPLCAASQLATHGDYVSATIGGWPLFAVRDGQTVRAYRNTCRHQNMMIVEKPVGHCDVLQCRYHGWQYALDGRFIAAPPLVAPVDPAAQQHHLEPLSIGTWRGLVFGNLRDDASGFTAPAALAAVKMSVTEHAFVQVRTTDVACNWKTFVEQRLADGWDLEWPLLAVRSTSNALIAEQVVPRSFLRTRIVSMVLGACDSHANVASAAEQAIQEAVPRIERTQQRLQDGETQLINAPAAHAFRAKVQAAIAR